MGYIYKTTNLINGKIYIGKSSRNDDSYLGSGVILQDAIQKHGLENFKKEILEECDENSIDDREKYWIEHYKARVRGIGYNIAAGGTGGDTTTCHPNKKDIVNKRANGIKEWWDSLSNDERAMLGKKISDGKSGKSNGREGYTHTEETIEKMKQSALEREISDSWKLAHETAMKKRRGVPLTKKYKKIIVNGVLYESVKAACEALNLKFRKYLYNGIKNGKYKVEYL